MHDARCGAEPARWPGEPGVVDPADAATADGLGEYTDTGALIAETIWLDDARPGVR